MKNDTQTEYVAAPAAVPAPVFPVLTSNPLVAIATALIGPILGLFRRRSTPTEVEKTKVEHYRSTPVTASRPPRCKDARTTPEGPSNHVSKRPTVAVRAYVRGAPAGRTAARKGGC